jgi:hypothetical protein
MFCAGADFDIADYSGRSVRANLLRKFDQCQDPTLDKIIKKLEKSVEEKTQIHWNPLIKLSRSEQWTAVAFLQAIGGQVIKMSPAGIAKLA